jgi:hypothetical protein|nr:MAG TPA: hypothetical protein [Caudoviricetes sp.]
MSTFNTIELLDPNKTVVVAEGGKLPALDGSLLTNLPGGSGGGSVERKVYTLSLSSPSVPAGSPIKEFTVTGRTVHIKIDAGTSLIMGKMYLVDTTDATDCVEVMLGSKFIPDGSGFAYVYDVTFDEAVDFSTNNLLIQTLG